QDHPQWGNYIVFYGYFHSDNGAALGASHQTGWTGVIARLMHLFATTSAEQVREGGKGAGVGDVEPIVAALGTPGWCPWSRLSRLRPRPREFGRSTLPGALPAQHAGLADRPRRGPRAAGHP